MLLKVKKQVVETVEFKTPAYYKDFIGDLFYVNEAGPLVKVNPRMILTWAPEDGSYYDDTIEELLRRGEPCTKEEFDKAYAEVVSKLDKAVGAVEI